MLVSEQMWPHGISKLTYSCGYTLSKACEEAAPQLVATKRPLALSPWRRSRHLAREAPHDELSRLGGFSRLRSYHGRRLLLSQSIRYERQPRGKTRASNGSWTRNVRPAMGAYGRVLVHMGSKPITLDAIPAYTLPTYSQLAPRFNPD